MDWKKFLLPAVLYGSILLILCLLVLITEKGSAELWINAGFTPFWGQFFRFATHLGDGIVYAILIAFFLLIRYYFSLMLLLVSIVQAIITQGLKRLFFQDAPRPVAYFENQEGVVLQLAEGVKIHLSLSFPSGHTATAFAIAVLLTYFFKKPVYAILFFVMAITAGFSRVYLMLHFFEDVLAGAAIGIFSSLLIIFISERFFPKWKTDPGLQSGLLLRRNNLL